METKEVKNRISKNIVEDLDKLFQESETEIKKIELQISTELDAGRKEAEKA